MKANRMLKIYGKIVMLLLCFMPFSNHLHAQYKIESLTRKEAPMLANPDEFVRDIKTKAREIVIRQIGKNAYDELCDTGYRYPWYYNNVYYNSAPSEMNYRVFFRFRIPGNGPVFDFELSFTPFGLELIHGVDYYLPDCSFNPAECLFISSEQALVIGSSAINYHFGGPGNVRFGYDSLYGTFVWNYYNSEYTEYPNGNKGFAVIDANSGNVLSSRLEKNVWMGKCLSEGTMIRIPGGERKVSELKVGDSVLSKTEDNTKFVSAVLEVNKVPVSEGYIMLQLLMDDGRELIVSPGHPTFTEKTWVKDLKAGDMLDGSTIKNINQLVYQGQFTWDILTTGLGGGYFANGIFIGSTMSPMFQKQ